MPKIPLLPFLKYFTNILFTELTLNFQSLFQHLFQCYSENVLKLDNEKGSNHTLFSSDVISKNNENQKMLCQYYKYEGFGQLCLIYYLQQCNRKKHVCMKSRTFPQNIIIIIFFLTSSKLISYFEKILLIFYQNEMASRCSKFHCHPISDLN